ncbi:PAS domain-containing sensor histidine kinase [Litorimonas sp. WD9-15]|uniref:PAS domain-containing sensor histidine kinase n=1 Tax=Litorimonas sp. WD9-15 TaxID=3418716 RepID=UPI003CFF0069
MATTCRLVKGISKVQNGQGQNGHNQGGVHGTSAQPYVPRPAQARSIPMGTAPTPHYSQQMPGRPAQGQRPQGFQPPPNAISTPVGTSKPLQSFSTSSSNDLVTRLSDRVGGRDIFKRLLITTLLFFTLFLIIATIKFVNDRQANLSEEITTFETRLITDSETVGKTLDSEFTWMETALTMRGGAQDIVNFTTQSQNIIGAALLNGDGRVIAETTNAGAALAQIDRRNFPTAGRKIDSLIDDGSVVRPVLIRRVGDNYLSVILKPGSLIGDLKGSKSLALESGRLIDAPISIATQGPQTYYRVSANQLSNMLQGSTSAKVSSLVRNDNKLWFGSASIRNSSLSILDTTPRGKNAGILQNLMLFGLLFLGSAWLIWMLMNQLLRQIDAMRDQNMQEEVSRQRYRAAVDGSNGGIWEVDLTRNLTYLSPSLAKTMGLKEQETHLPLPQFLALFSTAQRDQFYNHLKRAHLNGSFQIELGAAALPIYVSCRGRPTVREDQSKIVIGMALDITETRGAQARLQAAEARLFDALRSMNDSFVIWDQLDRLVLWNSKFEDFFGFEPGILRPGLPYSQVEFAAEAAIAQTVRLSDDTGNELELKDGRWVRYLETYTADGARVSIGTEVTTIRTREQQLQDNQNALEKTINVLRKSQVRIVELAEKYEQEKIRAEEANQSKSEFLANMSHELRTPLNAINGFSDIMKKEMFGPLGDARYKEYVNDILFSGQHLLSLINDILDMSKIEAGKMTLNTEHMVMSDMVGQVIRIIRGRADENRLKLIYDGRETPEIEADPRAVKQILLNLMTNAIKFTPEGGVVTVNVESKSAGLIVSVSDTGIGISEENIKRLAQPFEQIDSQNSRQHEGTGLGLALSKSLVELHGGNFNISSVIGEGTTVTFTLPVSVMKKQAKPIGSEVGSEISRLAQDIAEVLETSHEQIGAATPGSKPAPVQSPTTPLPLPMAPPHQSSAA